MYKVALYNIPKYVNWLDTYYRHRGYICYNSILWECRIFGKSSLNSNKQETPCHFPLSALWVIIIYIIIKIRLFYNIFINIFINIF